MNPNNNPCLFQTLARAFFSFEGALVSFLELNITVVPQSLEMISSQDTNRACYTTHFNEEGKLLIGCSDGIYIYSSDLRQAEHTLEVTHITSIARSRGESVYFFIGYDEDEDGDETVIVTKSSDFSQFDHAFKYKNPHTPAFLTVSENFIVMVMVVDECLIIYNRETEKVSEVSLNDGPLAVLFDGNGDLLVLVDRELRKYYICKEGGLSMVWRCGDMDNATSLAITRHGIIVVLSGKTLRVISASGEIVFDHILSMDFVNVSRNIST